MLRRLGACCAEGLQHLWPHVTTGARGFAVVVVHFAGAAAAWRQLHRDHTSAATCATMCYTGCRWSGGSGTRSIFGARRHVKQHTSSGSRMRSRQQWEMGRRTQRQMQRQRAAARQRHGGHHGARHTAGPMCSVGRAAAAAGGVCAVAMAVAATAEAGGSLLGRQQRGRRQWRPRLQLKQVLQQMPALETVSCFWWIVWLLMLAEEQRRPCVTPFEYPPTHLSWLCHRSSPDCYKLI